MGGGRTSTAKLAAQLVLAVTFNRSGTANAGQMAAPQTGIATKITAKKKLRRKLARRQRHPRRKRRACRNSRTLTCTGRGVPPRAIRRHAKAALASLKRSVESLLASPRNRRNK